MDIENIREKMIDDIIENGPAYCLVWLADIGDEVKNRAKENLENMVDRDLIREFEYIFDESIEEVYLEYINNG